MRNFEEGRYTAEKLQRNRMLVIVAFVGVVALFAALAVWTSWQWSNAIASSALALLFAAAFWWMFASRKAGPVTMSKASKSYMSDLMQPFRKRG